MLGGGGEEGLEVGGCDSGVFCGREEGGADLEPCELIMCFVVWEGDSEVANVGKTIGWGCRCQRLVRGV